MTLTDLCDRLRNWFDVRRHTGIFELKNGTIDLDFISGGQFYRLIGTTQYDGIVFATDKGNGLKLYYVFDVTPNGDFELVSLERDQVFKGEIWELQFPLNFILLYRKMGQWEQANRKVIDNPYTSENISGLYSYTKENENLNWKTHFKSDLARWQKL